MPPSRKQGMLCFLGKPSPVRRKTMIRSIKKIQKFQDKGREGRWIYGGNRKKKEEFLGIGKELKTEKERGSAWAVTGCSDREATGHCYGCCTPATMSFLMNTPGKSSSCFSVPGLLFGFGFGLTIDTCSLYKFNLSFV